MLDVALHAIETGNLDDARSVVGTALERQRATIRELRDLSFALEPVLRRDHVFGRAVNALAQDNGIEHEMKIELDVGAAEVLGERSQAALYQIIREALEGAVRRGPPKTFSVAIEPGEQQTLAVTIRDDAPSERRRRSIEVLEERARTLGAVISVDPDERGSTMRIVLPIYAASE